MTGDVVMDGDHAILVVEDKKTGIRVKPGRSASRLLHPGLVFQGGFGFGKVIAEPVRAFPGLREGAVDACFFQLEAALRQARESNDQGVGFQGMGG